MNAVIKAGVAMAVLVAVFSTILVLTGLHVSSPFVGMILFIVVAILVDLGCVFWGLAATAAENKYGKQLLNASLIGLIAAVLIFGFSLVQTKVIFPDYIDESQTALIEFYEEMPNVPEEQKEKMIASVEEMSAVGSAVSGAMFTIIFAVLGGALIGIFKRRK